MHMHLNRYAYVHIVHIIAANNGRLNRAKVFVFTHFKMESKSKKWKRQYMQRPHLRLISIANLSIIILEKQCSIKIRHNNFPRIL